MGTITSILHSFNRYVPLLDDRVPIARVLDSDELAITPFPYIPDFILTHILHVVSTFIEVPRDTVVFYDCSIHACFSERRQLSGRWEIEIRQYWDDPRSINFSSPMLYEF